MKIFRAILSGFLLFSAVMVSSSCAHTVIVAAPKHAPPGQVKKATGAKSAKAYAPGQQKKYGKK